MKDVRGKLWRMLPVLLLSGCGGASLSSSGSLSVGVVDGPVDGVSQVVLEFSEVDVHSADGTTQQFILPSAQQVDLLAMTNGKQGLLLDNQPLDAGYYDWVRLVVNEANSYVMTVGGNQEALQIPSNAQSGLKINHPFILAQGGVARFAIDFDLRKSLHLPVSGNQPYLLRPTLRMSDVATTGAIAGTVDAALVAGTNCKDFNNTAATGGAVYVWSGAGATPVDIDSTKTAGQPLTSAAVKTDSNGAWGYHVAFLDPGAYTVAFTCQATLDLPDSTEGIEFQGAADVTVTSGNTATHDFH